MAEKRENLEWSSTHVRLRAELLITSILMVALAHLDLKLEKIPVFGIDLLHPVPRGSLFIFLLAFWVYVLVALVSRTLLESWQINLAESDLASLETSLASDVEKISGIVAPDVAERFAVIDDQLQALRKEVGPIRGEELMTLLKPLQAQVVEGHTISGSMFQEIREFLDNPHADDAKGKLENRVTQQIAVLRDVIAEVEHTYRDVKDTLEQDHASRLAVPDLIEQVLRERQETLQNLTITQQQGLVTAMKHISANMTKIRRSIWRFWTLKSFDRNLWAFVVPVIFCAALTAISIPQGLVDARPTVDHFLTCAKQVTSNDWNCLIHREPGSPDVPSL